LLRFGAANALGTPGPSHSAESKVSQSPGSARGTRFDALKLAAEGESLAGELDARKLDRLADRLASGNDPATVHWQVAGGHDALRRPMVTLRIDAALPLVCQRCLQSFEAAIAQQTHLLLAKDDEELKRLDAEEPEVVLAAAPLDVRTLVEDELLLSLPFAPHHPEGQCAPGAGWGLERKRGEQQGERSPFAPLAGLKHRR
jgi:uncharacterized protein